MSSDPAPASSGPPGNSEQIDYWNGDTGGKWVRNQDRLDFAFSPLTAALLQKAAPQSGERAIDIGCGCGDLALTLADTLGPQGSVLAVDVSRPMLDQARMRGKAAGEGTRATVEWREGDAATLPFAKGEADLLISRFGVMFFADPVQAFRNLRRALRPGRATGHAVLASTRKERVGFGSSCGDVPSRASA